MDYLINSFPRIVSYPEKVVCKTRKEFYDLISKYNGIKSKIYYSILGCDEEKNHAGADLRVIFHDMDSKGCFNNAKKAHEWGLLHNYRHCIIFSTGGFWSYWFTRNYEGIPHDRSRKKATLENAQRWVADQIGLSIGPEKVADVDHHIISDIARVGRMPGTYDTGRGRYCIGVSHEDLEKGFDWIKEKSQKQDFKLYYYGSERIDMAQFDKPVPGSVSVDVPKWEGNIETDDKLLKIFPPCIQQWLTDPEKGIWKARYYFAVWCKDKGIPMEACDQLARKYFTLSPRTDELRNNYNHFQKVKALELAYTRDDFFPSKEILFQEGLCPGDCNSKHKCDNMYKTRRRGL